MVRRLSVIRDDERRHKKAGATLHLFLLKNIWRLSNDDSMKILQMASSKRYFFWRTLFFGKYVIWVYLRLSTRMSFMGRLDTPSFVADLNAWWIVVLRSEHEEYRETVDLTS